MLKQLAPNTDTEDTETPKSNSKVSGTEKNTNKVQRTMALIKNNPSIHPSWSLNFGELFLPEEIGMVFRELTTSLKTCINKEEQLCVMFELATKYIYNVEPNPSSKADEQP